MTRLKLRAAALFLMGAGMLGWRLPAHAKDVAWLPATPEELAMKDNPLSPGSSAMILYHEMITVDPESSESHWCRSQPASSYADTRSGVEQERIHCR